MKKIYKVLDKFEEYSLVVLLSVMTILIFIQVVCRFCFKNSLSWSEELARYILVWSTFLGASLGIKKGAHIGVEAFKLILPKNVKIVVEYIGIILCFIFSIIVFKNCSIILQKQFSTGQVSPAMQIPMWIPYLGVCLGAFLMSLRFIEAFITVKKENLEGSSK